MFLQCAAHFVVAEYIKQLVEKGGTEPECYQWATQGDRHFHQCDECFF